MEIGRVDPEWSPKTRAPRQWIAALLLLAATACIAAGYGIAKVNAHDWRTSNERARAVLASPIGSTEHRRDALYVLFRHEQANANAMKTAAQDGGVVGEHARNLLRATQECWR